MMKSGLFACAVAAVLGMGMMTGSASAAPLGSAATALVDVETAAPVENVAWVCRRNTCTWDPRFRGRVPNYARHWGPPRNSNCRWERVRTRDGDWRWREVCRRRGR